MSDTAEHFSNVSSLSFEAAFAELNRLVAQMESGELSLEESVMLYERGQSLAAHMQRLLDTAELRVKKLNEDGTLSALD